MANLIARRFGIRGIRARGARSRPRARALTPHKVQSIAFRAAHVPRGHVSVNADNGVVHLRGQLDTADQIDELVRAARAIEGVKGVRNPLHTPGTRAAGATTAEEGS